MTSVRVGVGGDDLLIDQPGDLDGEMVVAVEHLGQPGVLAWGEQLQAGSGDAPDPIERVTGVSAPTQGLLLDALADQVELGPGQSHNVEGVHHGDRVRDDLGGGGLVAGEPVHRNDLHGPGKVGGLGGQPRGQCGR
ncbi:hypothetical protein BKG74_05400 [Mycobacteroides chelonae]|nr:hypothetical protein AN933_24585 [Mycobacterium intracellulare subsp. chimaera]OHU28882.1 hypothetical protein BKG74_05400 [Mycobacteroides chelonae]